MTNSWFKFYGGDYLIDPKMLALSACERSCWITLLSYASMNDNAMITFMDEQTLMTQAGVDFNEEEWDRTIGVVEKFKKLKMITDDNGVITILNWQKRQQTNLTPYERVKRYREKQKFDNADDNVMITTDKIRIDKNRLDNIKEKYKKEKNFTPPTYDDVKKYCDDRKNQVDAQRFIDFYESKGWLVGKTKMKNWQAAVRTWEKGNKKSFESITV